MHKSAGRVGPDTRMECRICWHVYDPEEGDPDAQVAPGTPFTDLPEHWRCPECDGVRSQYLIMDE